MKEAEAIYKVIEDKFKVTKEEIISQKRTRHLVDIRRLITMVLIENTKFSYKKIADIIGREHCIVCHYQKTSPSIFETNEYLRNYYEYVSSRYKYVIDDGECIFEKYEYLLIKKTNIEKEIGKIKIIIDFNIEESQKKEELCITPA